jgi:hypothetical protein
MVVMTEGAAERLIDVLLGENQELKSEVARLRLQQQHPMPSAEAVQRPRRKMSLASRVKQSQSWTPARRAAASRRMHDFWMLEKATRPDHPNGLLAD